MTKINARFLRYFHLNNAQTRRVSALWCEKKSTRTNWFLSFACQQNHISRGVARVRGARGKLAPPYFSVYIFLPTGWHFENLRSEKWQAKKTKKQQQQKKIEFLTFHTRFNAHVQIQFKFTNQGHVISGLCLYKAYQFLLLLMRVGRSYNFYNWHDFAPPRSGARSKCPPLPKN